MPAGQRHGQGDAVHPALEKSLPLLCRPCGGHRRGELEKETTKEGGSMTTHPNKSAGASQNARILKSLQDQQGLWVPMPLLAAESGAYAVHSRVSDLRRAGHTIEHENSPHGRVTHSFYRMP